MKKIKSKTQDSKDLFVSTILELHGLKEYMKKIKDRHQEPLDSQKLEDIEKNIGEAEKELSSLMLLHLADQHHLNSLLREDG